MITKENTERRKVPIRTIIAAIAMLTGIVLLGFGYFQGKQVMMYAGVAITLGGVMTEAVLVVIGGTRGQRRKRIVRA
jgi:hypothetical protein